MTADEREEAPHREVLRGGVAYAGAVVRIGDEVTRPANTHSATIHRFLRHVRSIGFLGASEPLAIEGDRERLAFVAGDVPVPPYPAWAQTDAALASIVRLVRGLHDASAGFDVDHGSWSDELSDLAPGRHPVICHNDVCLENVVFRDGEAVALLDFDYAAPGRAAFDLAALARMCLPVDDDVNAPRFGWTPTDRPARLRLVADAYGLDPAGRSDLVACLDESIERGGEFVLRHVEAGEPGFVEMWNSMGGMERFDRRRRWWAAARHAFVDSLE